MEHKWLALYLVIGIWPSSKAKRNTVLQLKGNTLEFIIKKNNC